MRTASEQVQPPSDYFAPVRSINLLVARNPAWWSDTLIATSAYPGRLTRAL